MGNNAAFSDFEATTVMLYDQGVLSEAILSSIMERYRGTDIDHGGMAGTLAKDGLDCEEIVLKVFGVEVPKYPDVPKSMADWTEDQELAVEQYWEVRTGAFLKISMERFGWC